jgi:hypothetical protein
MIAKRSLTKHAPDAGIAPSVRFAEHLPQIRPLKFGRDKGIKESVIVFGGGKAVVSSFYCSQAESMPAPAPRSADTNR